MTSASATRSRLLAGVGALADLVWPLVCGGCQAPGARWCPGCAAWLDHPAATTRPVPCPPNLPAAWAVSPYAGVVREAIVAWKDGDRHDLTRPLGRALSRSTLAALESASPDDLPDGVSILVVPMPSRRAARRARGGDPVRELAVRAAATARRAGWAVRVAPALRHTRAVADQSGLGAAERATNLAGALEVRPGWRPRLAAAPCLLVDDIITTGATLAEAAGAVRRAGGHPFGLAVIAATERTLGGQVTKFRQGG
jgi:predicted amidophosphoribosyltransferase